MCSYKCPRIELGLGRVDTKRYTGTIFNFACGMLKTGVPGIYDISTRILIDRGLEAYLFGGTI